MWYVLLFLPILLFWLILASKCVSLLLKLSPQRQPPTPTTGQKGTVCSFPTLFGTSGGGGGYCAALTIAQTSKHNSNGKKQSASHSRFARCASWRCAPAPQLWCWDPWWWLKAPRGCPVAGASRERYSPGKWAATGHKRPNSAHGSNFVVLVVSRRATYHISLWPIQMPHVGVPTCPMMLLLVLRGILASPGAHPRTLTDLRKPSSLSRSVDMPVPPWMVATTLDRGHRRPTAPAAAGYPQH